MPEVTQISRDPKPWLNQLFPKDKGPLDQRSSWLAELGVEGGLGSGGSDRDRTWSQLFYQLVTNDG